MSILDPIRQTLNPFIWEDEKLKNDVKNYILDTLNNWLELNNIKDKLINLLMLGSNTTYQYSADSDLDINVNLNIDGEKIKELLKILPNGNLLPDTQHPINFYIVNNIDDIYEKDSPVYDILNDKWLVKPDKKDIIIPIPYITQACKAFSDSFDLTISSYESNIKELNLYYEKLKYEENKDSIMSFIEKKKTDISADLDSFYIMSKLLHSFRSDGFDKEKYNNLDIDNNVRGNFSLQNEIYKMLDKFGYVEKISKYLKIRKEWKYNLNPENKIEKEEPKKESQESLIEKGHGRYECPECGTTVKNCRCSAKTHPGLVGYILCNECDSNRPTSNDYINNTDKAKNYKEKIFKTKEEYQDFKNLNKQKIESINKIHIMYKEDTLKALQSDISSRLKNHGKSISADVYYKLLNSLTKKHKDLSQKYIGTFLNQELGKKGIEVSTK